MPDIQYPAPTLLGHYAILSTLYQHLPGRCAVQGNRLQLQLTRWLHCAIPHFGILCWLPYSYTRHFESSFRLTKFHLNLRKSIFIYGVWRSGAIASVEVEADFLVLHNVKINVGREY